MKTDPIPEELTPGSISQDDALKLASQNKSFAEHVLTSVAQRPMIDKIRRENPPPPAQNQKVTKGRHPISAYPTWNGDQLRKKLKEYNRTPFIDLLATFIECTPDPDTIIEFANKYPDRFVRAISDLGRLAGFADKKDIDINLSTKISALSDSQLEDQLREVAYKMGIPVPKVLELTVISAEPESVTPAAVSDQAP